MSFVITIHRMTMSILSLSCWLSTEKGTIFAFVAPVLAIVIVGG